MQIESRPPLPFPFNFPTTVSLSYVFFLCIIKCNFFFLIFSLQPSATFFSLFFLLQPSAVFFSFVFFTLQPKLQSQIPIIKITFIPVTVTPKNTPRKRSDVVWKHCISVVGDTRQLQCKYCQKVLTGEFID